MSWAAGLGVAPAEAPGAVPKKSRRKAEQGQQGKLFAPEVVAAPQQAGPAEAVPPGDILGRWKLTGEHVSRAVRDWVLAHRVAWPLDPSPGITARERKMIKDLVSMFGPEVWEKMCAISCTGWASIRDLYRIRDRRPDLRWVYLKRNDVAAAAASGGFASRSNRGAAGLARDAAQPAPADSAGKFGW